MTAEDLKELGISSFGHRRRLLNAITFLRGGPPTRDAAQSATSVTSAPTSPPPIGAERRQLTVMFCDLVGSTALSARLDPEDLREVIGAYHRCVANVVAGFGGFVSRYMGDGVLVYFGYPLAHEDDAERAVPTGLGAIDAVSL
jgi:class 3 adenylate cyclase